VRRDAADRSVNLFSASCDGTLEGVSWLRRSVRRRLGELRLPGGVIDAIQLIVAEIGANAVVHAPREPKTVGLEVRLEGLVLRVELTDDGASFHAFREHWAASDKNPAPLLAPGGKGLALVKALVEDASYTPGLPNAWSATVALRKQRSSVLLIEDVESLRATYASILHQRFDVVAAATLEEATALALSHPVDAIVADLHLGDERCTTLCHVLDADDTRPPVPMLVLTSDRDPAVHGAALAMGVDRVMAKPVTPARLIEALDDLILKSTRQGLRLLRHYRAEVEAARRFRCPDAGSGHHVLYRGLASALGGGDFLLSLPTPGGVRVIAGDVMGHGLRAQAAAAAFAAVLRTCHHLLPPGGAGALLTAANRVLFEDAIVQDCFMTLVVADLNRDRTVTFASAGHPHPVVFSAAGIRPVALDGPLPGVIPDHDYREATVALAPGERVALFSDGLDPRGSMVGDEGLPGWLSRILIHSAQKPLEEAADRIVAEAALRLGEPPPDDWTILLAEPVGDAP
jgi:serine/threonine-protein kinase RsbW